MINITLLILSFFFMELVAWSNHKYIRLGFMWKWHKDHHSKDIGKDVPENIENKNFEKNDLFFLRYAIPAIILLLLGFIFNYLSFIFIGIGISFYGFTYFIIHDIIIHKRISIRFLQKNHNLYVKALIKAHSAYHRGENPHDF